MSSPPPALRSFDFRQPGRPTGGVERVLGTWQRRFAGNVAERWNQNCPSPVEWRLTGNETVQPGQALAQLGDTQVGYRVAVGDYDADTLWVFHRPLLLAVVAAMLGEQLEALPADRDLTSVEHSLAEMAVQELAAALTESWPGAESIDCRYGGADPKPKHTKQFLKCDALIRSAFAVAGPFGSETAQWLLPGELVEKLAPSGVGAVQKSEDQKKLMQLVREVPVDLSARLGETTMHISQLAQLRAGDVVILDQRVSEPVLVCVEDRAKFRAWAGRVGARQALFVESSVEG
jgi:flagellar motor switch protein FliM